MKRPVPTPSQEEYDLYLTAAIEEALRWPGLRAPDGALRDAPYVDAFLARLIERMARRDGRR